MVMDEKPGNGAPKPPRKTKFMPKAPPRRAQKLVLPKPEKFEEAEVDDVKAQELMKRFQETSNKPKIKTETKPASKARVSSFNFGTKSEVATSGIGSKEYKEPWDYYKYYPVTLPVRMPYAGNPELLDEEEFKEDSETNTYNESSFKPSEELGFLDEDLEKKMFLQFPATMPLLNESIKTEGGPASSSKTPIKNASKLCAFNDLPDGLMGKMLVYKNGDVKLKLGDIMFKVSEGLDCVFSQDAAYLNGEEEYCSQIGELNKRAIVTPDIEFALESMDL